MTDLTYDVALTLSSPLPLDELARDVSAAYADALLEVVFVGSHRASPPGPRLRVELVAHLRETSLDLDGAAAISAVTTLVTEPLRELDPRPTLVALEVHPRAPHPEP